MVEALLLFLLSFKKLLCSFFEHFLDKFLDDWFVERRFFECMLVWGVLLFFETSVF